MANGVAKTPLEIKVSSYMFVLVPISSIFLSFYSLPLRRISVSGGTLERQSDIKTRLYVHIEPLFVQGGLY